MTRVSGDWLTSSTTQAVFSLLADSGFQAYAVGGCIRNALLHVPVADVDFATDATPQQVIGLANDAGIKAIPTGIDHGTVTVVADGIGHEVTTFRKDVATDGRRAVVSFSRSIAQDAQRRDFTINALYADHAGQILDPLGGLADITARKVRFINDAPARIREDYLRILRFFRFCAWFGNPDGGIDADALAACARYASQLETLSHERIGAEMAKLLYAPDPAPALASMEGAGVLMRIVPGAAATTMALLVHLEQQSGAPPDWIRRLANLGGEDLAAALRLSRKEARQLKLLQNGLKSDATISELAYRLGAAAARDIALLRSAATATALPAGLAQKISHATAQTFPLGANDIRTGETGAALGKRLKTLEQRWIDSGFTLGKAELLG